VFVSKPLVLGGKSLKFPLVCTPLVGRSYAQILSEVQHVLPKNPDLLEWRVDFFEGIADTVQVLALAAAIRQEAPGIPVLFTRRSCREGGEPIALDEPAVLALYAAVMQSQTVDFVDFEMCSEPAHISQVRAQSSAHGIGLVLSFHDFHATPSQEVLCQRFAHAQQLGADVAKIAVMPQRLEDVLVLLAATLESSQKLDIPVISMSMGAYGAVTRLVGGVFGSAMSFAMGAAASAPGQLPIEDLQTVLQIVNRATRPAQ
jgi:3-dehydroquinate dehydratase-1